ncbi:MAG: MerR family transcriptional regulator [Erysipelotrichaceae bacterium]|mgnify:FL=1
MSYSIGEVSKLTGLSVPTLRYYDKEGLIPNINRNENGLRDFTEQDLGTIHIVTCIKGAGASIREIKEYMDLCQLGDSTLELRKQFFIEKKRDVEEQMKELNEIMKTVEMKIKYYEDAIEAGTEGIHRRK